jgi:hypothetical protein
MFMGIIAAPSEENNFSGKVNIIRLSKQHRSLQNTYRQHFHNDHDVNQLLKDEDWRRLYDGMFTIAEILTLIVDYYGLEETIENTLCLRYVTHVGENRERSWQMLLDHDTIQEHQIRTEDGNQRQLTLDDTNLFCFLPRGTAVEREVNCNSVFMLENIPIVGAEIRRSMHWIPPEQEIYLVMDNAGGHGTEEAVDEYTRILNEEYNIIILHQAPRSPETNALDLGLWMSLQSHVEKLHRNRTRDPDGLAVSVKQAWDHLPVETIQKVFDRIPVVLQLIVEGDGDNINVEDRRGRHNNPPPEG